MKTVYLLLCLLFAGCLNIKAQQNINDVQSVNYYGIDFSKVKIFRAKESPEQFQKAFKAINDLTLKENKKYNFEKLLKKSLDTKSFATVDKRNAENAPTILPRKMSSRELEAIRLTPEEVKEIIGSYGNDDNGVGVVIITVLLNKDKPEAVYDVVFFDVKTKEIIFEKYVDGEAGGAGLRNFWANTVTDALKGWKYKIK